MKILSLRLKNLNSLKGEWKIDFTAEPFASNGLFAITGPTGAGKTTLLDAICLALYHRTPRMDKVGGENELMTRHTAECLAEKSDRKFLANDCIRTVVMIPAPDRAKAWRQVQVMRVYKKEKLDYPVVGIAALPDEKLIKGSKSWLKGCYGVPGDPPHYNADGSAVAEAAATAIRDWCSGLGGRAHCTSACGAASTSAEHPGGSVMTYRGSRCASRSTRRSSGR